jgi:long-chain fatty acid transport protein
LRAGFNHGTNPIRPQDVTFNILAPGVVQNHASVGFTYGISSNSEISGALMVAQRVSVSGPSLFNAVLGAGAGGNESIQMRQISFGLAWAHKF